MNKKAENHSGSTPNMENTVERIAKCRYKTKMDKSYKGMIAATQPICAVWEGVPTRAMCMCFSMCCEVVSRLQFGALGGLGGGVG